MTGPSTLSFASAGFLDSISKGSPGTKRFGHRAVPLPVTSKTLPVFSTYGDVLRVQLLLPAAREINNGLSLRTMEA